MGASGSGKTSLLNFISDRISHKSGVKLSGSVLLNNKEKVTRSTFGKVACFVMQDDILFGYLTVEEALTFAARLRLATLSKTE
jgi:ABC-type multidrug transport system ATPase subunit